MGFDPQTTGQPIMNVRKKTTKVNVFMSVGVGVFFLFALGYILWAAHRDNRPEPAKPPSEQRK